MENLGRIGFFLEILLILLLTLLFQQIQLLWNQRNISSLLEISYVFWNVHESNLNVIQIRHLYPQKRCNHLCTFHTSCILNRLILWWPWFSENKKKLVLVQKGVLSTRIGNLGAQKGYIRSNVAINAMRKFFLGESIHGFIYHSFIFC